MAGRSHPEKRNMGEAPDAGFRGETRTFVRDVTRSPFPRTPVRWPGRLKVNSKSPFNKLTEDKKR